MTYSNIEHIGMFRVGGGGGCRIRGGVRIRQSDSNFNEMSNNLEGVPVGYLLHARLTHAWPEGDVRVRI